MKQQFTILFTVIFAAGWGQSFVYPSIKTEGKSSSDFVPKGWKVFDSAYGDLNNDNKADMALIFQDKDTVKTIEELDEVTDTILFHPRILAIFFYNDSSKQYQLIEESNSFILKQNILRMDDPFESIAIEHDVLIIGFQSLYNSGSNWSSSTKYKFRYQNNDFALIGADDESSNRLTNDYDNTSYNFLSKKWSEIKGNDTIEQTPKPEWHTLDSKELKTLKLLAQPFTWEVMDGVWL